MILVSTRIRQFKRGQEVLEKWFIECRDKESKGHLQNFSYSSLSNKPPNSNTVCYISNSSTKFGDYVFISFDGIDVCDVTNVNFY